LARHTRNWQPIVAVTLNPEKEAVVNAALAEDKVSASREGKVGETQEITVHARWDTQADRTQRCGSNVAERISDVALYSASSIH
jgi:hypothetical protein